MTFRVGNPNRPPMACGPRENRRPLPWSSSDSVRFGSKARQPVTRQVLITKIKLLSRYYKAPGATLKGYFTRFYKNDQEDYKLRQTVMDAYKRTEAVLGKASKIDIDGLAKALRDIHCSVNTAFASTIRDAWVEALFKNDKDLDVCIAATKVLDTISDKRLRDRLIEKACQDTSHKVRLEAVEQLRHHSDQERATQIARKMTSDNSYTVKSKARRIHSDLTQKEYVPEPEPDTGKLDMSWSTANPQSIRPELVDEVRKFRWFHPGSYSNAQIDRFLQEVEQEPGHLVRFTMKNLLEKIKGCQWAGGYERQDVAKQIAQFEDPEVRFLWIETLLKNERHHGLRVAASKAVLTIPDVARRDDAIARVCTDDESPVRIEGVRLLPYMVNTKKQQQLLHTLAHDKYDPVRKRAEILQGKHRWTAWWEGEKLFKGPLTDGPVLYQLQSPGQAQDTQKISRFADLRAQINRLSDTLEAQMKAAYQGNVADQKVLAGRYLDESRLPKAEQIREHHTKLARGYLKGEQPWWQRLLRRPVNEGKLLEMTRMLLEAAEKTGNAMPHHLRPDSILLIREISHEQFEADQAMARIEQTMVSKVLMRSKAEVQLKEQAQEVARLELEEKHAIEAEEHLKYAEVKGTLEVERLKLKHYRERFQALQASVALVQEEVQAMTQNLEQYRLCLVNALLYGSLDTSLSRSGETSAKSRVGPDRIKTMLEEANRNRYRVLAEHQRRLEEKAISDEADFFLAKARASQANTGAKTETPPSSQTKTLEAELEN